MATASLETRVRRLETSTGSGNNCPECGCDGITPLRPECFWSYDDEGPVKDIYCGRCGQAIHITVSWGDAPTDEPP
jgi:hypothetical protein